MQATKQSKLNKAFSVFVAFALALLMVPIVPGSVQTAVAEGSTTAGYPVAGSGNGFINKLVYDQFGDESANATVTQSLNWGDIAKLATLTYPEKSDSTVQTNVAADAKASAEADLKAKAEAGKDDAAANDVKTNKSTDIDAALNNWVEENESSFSTKAKADATTAIGASNIKEGTEVTITEVSSPTTYDKNSAKATATTVALKNDAYSLTDDKATVVEDSIKFEPTNPAPAKNGSVAASGDAVEITSVAADSFQMQAIDAAKTSTITLAFTYDAVVGEYSYTYAGNYELTYAGFEYEGWTCSKQYNYSYTDVNDGIVSSTTPITVTLQGGKVSKTYDSPVEATVGVEVTDPVSVTEKTIATGSADQSGEYSYTVSTVNLFPDSAVVKSLGEVDFASTADIDLFEGIDFGHDFEDVARGKLSEPSTTSAHLSVGKKSDGVATATAIQKGEDTTSVTWEYNGHEFSRDVTVDVRALQIDMSDFKIAGDQPFRLKGDVEAIVLDAANAAVLEKVNAANATAGAGDIADAYFSAVDLTDFDTTGQASQQPGASWTEADSAAYGNFDIQNMPEASGFVTVSKMRDEEWPSGLTLSANKDLASPSDAEQWINRKPSATYAGHLLAYDVTAAPAAEEAYAANVDLNGGDGTHNDVALYALAEDGHEITHVTGVSYKLDTQAPVLLSAEYKTPNGGSTISTGTTLFGKDTVEVDLGIVDRVKENGSEAAKTDTFKNVESGLKEQPKVTYHDNEANADHTPNLAVSEPIYSFSLGGNEDVLTDSIKVYAIDNAGNELNWVSATDAENIPVSVLRLVADADAPEINVTWDNYDVRNGSFYAANRTMTITVTEKFFNYIQDYQSGQELAAISGSNGTAVVVHPSDFSETSPNSNVWVYRYTFSSDADWSVSNIHITDLVGHSAGVSNESFTIDKTTPTMDVVFDNNSASNGNYYNAARTATITVNEHNFNPGLVNIEPTANAGNGDSVGSPDVSGWSSNGDVRTATVYFPGEGVYTLSVSGVDSANNPLPGYTASEFVIDTTVPQIQISGVDNLQAYSGSAQPGVTVQDTNISDATTIELTKISYPMNAKDANPYSESRSNATTEITVSYPDAGQVVENDGVYTLTVQAVDMAGNSANQAVTWSVNRFGSTYVLSDTTSKMVNNYLQSSKVNNVMVTEINPSGLNMSATAVELTRDTKNTTLKSGSDYSVASGDSAGWSTYTYTVNKGNFDSDGSYRVLFHSQDNASNTSENTMKNKNATRTATAEVAFAVDDTAPIVSFIDLDSNALYDESTHTAQVSIEDNLKLDTADVKIDGEKVLELDSAALSESATHSFDVPESAAAQEIVVTAYDAAGNAETVAATNVTVTTDPVKLWMNNTPLFVGTIVGGIVIIGAVIAFFATRGRRTSL